MGFNIELLVNYNRKLKTRFICLLLSKSIGKWEKEGRKENFVTKCSFSFDFSRRV